MIDVTTSAKARELMDLAESYIRSVGFNGFSFRDLAEDAGIKSASVHYHFATKEALAIAVSRRYSSNFFAALKQGEQNTPRAQLELFVSLFRGALDADGRMCLYCVLGAEFSALPSQLQAEVRAFYIQCSKVLEALLTRFEINARNSRREIESQARTIVSSLEGAMIVSRASDDLKIFDAVVENLNHSGLMPSR
jgi:TetR/AcrR family transcriptional regulator, transcriptional repressor for nem operon